VIHLAQQNVKFCGQAPALWCADAVRVPASNPAGSSFATPTCPLRATRGARCGFRLVRLRARGVRPWSGGRLAWCHRRGLLHNGHYRTLERINLRLEGRYCVGQCFCCGLFGCQKLENCLHIAGRALLQSLQTFYQPNYLVRVYSGCGLVRPSARRGRRCFSCLPMDDPQSGPNIIPINFPSNRAAR
jgi:hypothetical protein